MEWLKKLLQFSKAENQNPFSSVNYLFEEARETDRAMMLASVHQGAILNILDGFADCAFVSLSGMRKALLEVKIPSKLSPGTDMSIPEDKVEECVNQIMLAVCEANLAKVGPDGKFIKDKNGKIIKPKGWVAPEEKIMDILQAHATQTKKVIH